jgi:hypothetical protein
MTQPAITQPAPAARHRFRLGIALPAGLGAVAAAAMLLAWWRADRGAVLLSSGPVTLIRRGAAASHEVRGGRVVAGSVTELAPDVWTGVEVAGPWAVVIVVAAGAALVAALLAGLGSRRLADVAGWTAVAAGLTAVAGAGRALVQWGPSGAAGVWVTLAAGIAAVGSVPALARRETRVPVRRVVRPGTAGPAFRPAGGRSALIPVVVVVAVAGAVAVVPAGPTPSSRAMTGPFVPVAAVGTFPLRSGEAGLAAADDARPIVADGAAGIVSRAGVVVATADGRARVLARPDRGAPAPIGVAGDRVVRWISADSVAVTELRAGSPVDIVVRGVSEAGALGADGSVWLRSDADPVGTVRRLDIARLHGEQRIAATYLPLVTIQEAEPPVDLRTVLPVRGGGLRALAEAGRLELLTGTAAGIATTPLAGTRCGAAGVANLDRAAADGSGVWFVLVSADGERLAHLEPASDGAVRTVPAVLPGTVTALAAPGDGSLLLVARDSQGAALWRLPDAAAALGATSEPPLTCPPAP